MIEFKQLQQLVAVAECGTVSQAARKLFLSQPALSRSMQKLESELAVKIFSRRGNRIKLTELGMFAVDAAKKILSDSAAFTENLRTADRRRRSVILGGCAPAPLWLLTESLNAICPDKTVITELKEEQELIDGLTYGIYDAIVTVSIPQTANCITKEICSEKLFLCVPKGHKLAGNREGVSFKQIDGISMLIYEHIGSWNKVKDLLPDTRFIKQKEMGPFGELINESALPCFSTDLAMRHYGSLPANRTVIPITDAEAAETFYATALNNNSFLIENL